MHIMKLNTSWTNSMIESKVSIKKKKLGWETENQSHLITWELKINNTGNEDHDCYYKGVKQ